LRRGNQQAAIIGAQIQRRVNGFFTLAFVRTRARTRAHAGILRSLQHILTLYRPRRRQRNLVWLNLQIQHKGD